MEDTITVSALEEKLSVQPKVIVVGEDVNNLKEFSVYLNGSIYKVHTLLAAQS